MTRCRVCVPNDTWDGGTKLLARSLEGSDPSRVAEKTTPAKTRREVVERRVEKHRYPLPILRIG